MSIDQYMGRKFSVKHYNCWDFVRDVWLDHTREDIGKRTPEKVNRSELCRAFRDGEHMFFRLESPEHPCIALLLNPASLDHVGVYIRGRILHLNETGVHHDTPETALIGYREIRYYTT